KATTPGALDNAVGVAALLALVDVRALPPEVGLIAFNGEDHYAAPGEQAWLAAHDPREVTLAVNLDGIGLRGAPTGIAWIGLPEQLAELVRAETSEARGLVWDEPWYESDHAIFAMAGVPTLALTSAAPHDRLEGLSHGPGGGIDAINVERVTEAASFVARLLHRLP
ncbi:MAG TPA: M28 family peptidase, partial [Patescibacteria group bacterium]|nr:M28 family peptidase [Patescibacteria group bacterium]